MTHQFSHILGGPLVPEFATSRASCVRSPWFNQIQVSTRTLFPSALVQYLVCDFDKDRHFRDGESWDTCMLKMQKANAANRGRKGSFLQVDLRTWHPFSAHAADVVLVEATGPVGSGLLFQEVGAAHLGSAADDTDAMFVSLPYRGATGVHTALVAAEHTYGGSWMQDPMNCQWRETWDVIYAV